MRPEATHRSDAVCRPDPAGADSRGDLSRRVADLAQSPDLYKYSGGGQRDQYNCSGDQANRFLPQCSIERERSGGHGPAGEVQSPTEKDAAARLLDGNSTPQQQLAAVRELSSMGISNLTVQGKDGQSYNLRLEREPAGSRELVHLHMTGPDGKERVVLRGVANPDGSFSQERDRHGRQVDFMGSAGARFKAINPNDNSSPPDENDQPPLPPDRRRRPDGGPDFRPPDLRPDVQPGSIDRSSFDAQLSDPRVMAAFAGRMNSEVGSHGPAAQLAFAEEVMNRAMARNQTIMQALTGSYYPTHNPGCSRNPAYIAAISKAWKEGTDTILGATGNASGRVGFGVPGGHYDANHKWVSPNQTVNINGERFGYEQVDLNKGWMEKYRRLKAGSAVRTDF